MKTAIASICIALIIGVLGLFQFEEFQKQFQSIQINLTKLDTRLDSEVQGLREEVNSLKQQLGVTAAQISNIPKTATDAEKIAEIKYLIFLANTRLKNAQDVSGALQLLSTASDSISGFADPNFQSFHLAVKKDIETLKQVSLPNSQGLWNKVDKILEETKTLSPKGIPSKVEEDPKKTTSVTKDTSKENIPSKPWKETLLKSFNEVKDLIKIRHHTKPVEPLLSETEQSMIKQNLTTLLEQTRLSILQQDDEIFHKSIFNTKQWLNSYYDMEDPKVKNIQNTLEVLAENHLKIELPSLISFPALNTLGEK